MHELKKTNSDSIHFYDYFCFSLNIRLQSLPYRNK